MSEERAAIGKAIQAMRYAAATVGDAWRCGREHKRAGDIWVEAHRGRCWSAERQLDAAIEALSDARQAWEGRGRDEGGS